MIEDLAREEKITTRKDEEIRAIEKEMANARIAFEKLKDISVEQMKSRKLD